MTSGEPESNGGSPGRQPSGDLWSIPLGAVELDEAALWGNGDILDRLSAVLPESESESALGSAPLSAPALPGAVHEGRAGTRRARRAAEAAAVDGGPGRRRRGGAVPRAAGAHGLSRGLLVAILAVAFSGAVLVGMLFTRSPAGSGQPSPSGSSIPVDPASDQLIVTNGPSECPMYAAAPEGLRVPPDPQAGECFFVG